MQITETESCERNIAFTWFHGSYTEEQAQWSAELQDMNFKNVKQYYGELYHEQEAASQ